MTAHSRSYCKCTYIHKETRFCHWSGYNVCFGASSCLLRGPWIRGNCLPTVSTIHTWVHPNSQLQSAVWHVRDPKLMRGFHECQGTLSHHCSVGEVQTLWEACDQHVCVPYCLNLWQQGQNGHHACLAAHLCALPVFVHLSLHTMYVHVQHGALHSTHLVHIPLLNDWVKDNIKLVQEIHNLHLFDGMGMMEAIH